MDLVAPNLAALIGEIIGARLISHAGSLTNLAKYPASTVQILGAEKALFRALKTKGNTPKYGACAAAGSRRGWLVEGPGGLIFHSSFIGRAQSKNKGRISRYLANKCSLASRIDCFSDEATTVFGEKLKDQVRRGAPWCSLVVPGGADPWASMNGLKVSSLALHGLAAWQPGSLAVTPWFVGWAPSPGQVEERLTFLSEGTTPRKNLEVMQEAIKEALELAVVGPDLGNREMNAESFGNHPPFCTRELIFCLGR
eukprot:Skav201949  [mRNA]  locus=scaffold2764:142053:144777:- [translate_table: standard]